MAEDRAFRIWQERLRAALRGWEASDQDEGALLRGLPLAEAEGWLEEREGELSAAEVEYIQASVSLRERRQMQRERQATADHPGVGGGLVVALVLALLAGQQWRRADGQVDARATAQADAEAAEQDALRLAGVSLAAQALAELEGAAPERAVLLALEALEGYPYSGQAESALAQAVEEYKPYTLLQYDSAEWHNAAWSPDGEVIAAVGGYYSSWWGTLAFGR